MRKVFIAIWFWLMRLVNGPTLPAQSVGLTATMPHIGPSDAQDDERRHDNEMAVAMADLRQQRLALQHTIRLAHRANLISFLALLIAIATLVITIKGQADSNYGGGNNYPAPMHERYMRGL